MAIFRSHDLQTKRCLTFCSVPLWNLAHPYGSGRVAAYTPNVHSLPLSSQAQSNHGCDLWLHILGKQKSRSMKLYDRRIGFLFCGILTVCTARIFYRKVSHFTWRLNHKIFCFHTYYTCRYRKVNPIPCLQSSISCKFHRVKSVWSSYVNLHQQMQNGFVLYLPSWFW